LTLQEKKELAKQKDRKTWGGRLVDAAEKETKSSKQTTVDSNQTPKNAVISSMWTLALIIPVLALLLGGYFALQHFN